MRNIGLLNDNFEVHPEYHRIMKLSNVNKFFFGTTETPHGTLCTQNFIDKNIIIKYKNDLYLILSNINGYLNSFDIKNLEKYNKYIIINYCNLYKYPLVGIQSNLNVFIKDFISYLQQTKPFHYNIIIELLGDKYFKGKIVAYEESSNILSVIFGSFLVISFGLTNINTPLYVNLLDYQSKYKSIYDDINKTILMTSPDNYVINNLSIITGNPAFAALLVQSHNNKNEYCIPIDELVKLTKFKSKELKKEYIDYFCSIYTEHSIWNTQNINDYEIICLNFEGLNKYFLNLEMKYLYSFDVKESINNLYYSITNELICSYKTLYLNRCI